PWQITFTTLDADPRASILASLHHSNSTPALIINQPYLGLTNFQILFTTQQVQSTNLPTTLSFRQPRQTPYQLPFGQCVFTDLTFLPGTVTLDLFNHQIELLPRTLLIDRQEHPWKANTSLSLGAR